MVRASVDSKKDQKARFDRRDKAIFEGGGSG